MVSFFEEGTIINEKNVNYIILIIIVPVIATFIIITFLKSDYPEFVFLFSTLISHLVITRLQDNVDKDI